MKFALMFYIFILYQCCYGYPIEEELTNGTEIQNGTYIIQYPDLIAQLNGTNSSYIDDMHGFAKKVVTKVKGGLNKVKGGFNKVKEKVKVGIGKIKDKISKIGTGGGGSSGNHDNYYRRPYYKPRPTSNYSGGGAIDPNVKWVLMGLGIFLAVAVIGSMSYYYLVTK